MVEPWKGAKNEKRMLTKLGVWGGAVFGRGMGVVNGR